MNMGNSIAAPLRKPSGAPGLHGKGALRSSTGARKVGPRDGRSGRDGASSVETGGLLVVCWRLVGQLMSTYGLMFLVFE